MKMSQHFPFPATPRNVTPKDSRCRDTAFSLRGCFPCLASTALAHPGTMFSTLWDYSRAFKSCLSVTSNSGFEKEKQVPISCSFWASSPSSSFTTLIICKYIPNLPAAPLCSSHPSPWGSSRHLCQQGCHISPPDLMPSSTLLPNMSTFLFNLLWNYLYQWFSAENLSQAFKNS